MEPTSHKISTTVIFSSILIRLLSFCILVLFARSAYVITLKLHQSCDFLDYSCFFPAPIHSPDVDLHRKFYASVFQELITQGFLATNSTSLCIEFETLGGDGDTFVALRKVGVRKSIGVSSTKLFVRSFGNQSFYFVFCSEMDRVLHPVEFVSEVT